MAQDALALDRDPDFAQCWAGQANAFVMRAIRYGDAGTWIDRVEVLARRALTLAPTLAEAHRDPLAGYLMGTGPRGRFDSANTRTPPPDSTRFGARIPTGVGSG